METAGAQDDVHEDLENSVVALGVELFASHGNGHDEGTQKLISLMTSSRCSTPAQLAKSDSVRPSLTSTVERRQAIMEIHRLFREEFGHSGRDVNQAAASAVRRLSQDCVQRPSQLSSQNSDGDDERKHALETLKEAFLKEIEELSQETDANGAVAQLFLKLGKAISVQKPSLEETDSDDIFVQPESSSMPEIPPTPKTPQAKPPAFAPTPRSKTNAGPMLPSSDPDDSCRGVCIGNDAR